MDALLRRALASVATHTEAAPARTSARAAERAVLGDKPYIRRTADEHRTSIMLAQQCLHMARRSYSPSLGQSLG